MDSSSFGVVTRGPPLLGKSTSDPVAANLLTVFLTVYLCIDSLRAISLCCNPASTTPNILFSDRRESNGILKLQTDTDSEKKDNILNQISSTQLTPLTIEAQLKLGNCVFRVN